jgi:uncharacterized protein YkwD
MARITSSKVILVFLTFLCTLSGLSGSTYSNPLPTCSPPKSHIARSIQDWRAKQLFEYARQENRLLAWDSCLATQAHLRAAQLAARGGTLSHTDPRTGKHPALGLIGACYSWKCAGENLVRGHVSPETLHKALMRSPSHRHTILNSRFKFLGVGCAGDVCVELFAGV